MDRGRVKLSQILIVLEVAEHLIFHPECIVNFFTFSIFGSNSLNLNPKECRFLAIMQNSVKVPS